jgi:hypothetical protein
MRHIGFVIPWVYHFLSRLQSLLARSSNRRFVKDLELMQSILKKAKEGIDINLLTFRSLDRIYYSNSCPIGRGSYSNQEHAWCFKAPDNPQFRATNNFLKFLAAIITPWINIINGGLKQKDCAMSMTDSTTAKEWMKKSNFHKHNNDPIQGTTHIDAARHYTQLFMGLEVKGYIQWFAGKQNNVTDALSKDWHRNDNKLTSILRSQFPKQMPKHYEIAPLPNNISSWLTLLLQRLPMRE